MELPILTETELFADLVKLYPEHVAEAFILYREGKSIKQIMCRCYHGRKHNLQSIIRRGATITPDYLNWRGSQLIPRREQIVDSDRQRVARILESVRRDYPERARIMRLAMRHSVKEIVAITGIPQRTIYNWLSSAR